MWPTVYLSFPVSEYVPIGLDRSVFATHFIFTNNNVYSYFSIISLNSDFKPFVIKFRSEKFRFFFFLIGPFIGTFKYFYMK